MAVGGPTLASPRARRVVRQPRSAGSSTTVHPRARGVDSRPEARVPRERGSSPRATARADLGAGRGRRRVVGDTVQFRLFADDAGHHVVGSPSQRFVRTSQTPRDGEPSASSTRSRATPNATGIDIVSFRRGERKDDNVRRSTCGSGPGARACSTSARRRRRRACCAPSAGGRSCRPRSTESRPPVCGQPSPRTIARSATSGKDTRWPRDQENRTAGGQANPKLDSTVKVTLLPKHSYPASTSVAPMARNSFRSLAASGPSGTAAPPRRSARPPPRATEPRVARTACAQCPHRRRPRRRGRARGARATGSACAAASA